MMYFNNNNECAIEQQQPAVDKREQRFGAELERLLKLRLRTKKGFMLHRRHSCPSTLTTKVVVIDVEGVPTQQQQHHRRCSVQAAPRRASFCDNTQQCTSASTSTCVAASEEKAIGDCRNKMTSNENDTSSANKGKVTASRRKSLTQRRTRLQINSALDTFINRIRQSTSQRTARSVYTSMPSTTIQLQLFCFRSTLVKASFFLIIVLMFMTLCEPSSGGVKGAVLKPSCRKVGYQSVIDESGCDLVAVFVNRCSGYCTSFSFPDPYQNNKVVAFSKCCRMTDVELIEVNVNCGDTVKTVKVPSARECSCFDCIAT